MSKKISQRSLRIGDVIEIFTSRGYAYAQCTHRDSFHGPLVRVQKNFQMARISDPAAVVDGESSFAVFLDWHKDIDHSRVHIIGKCAVPDKYQSFPLFKAGIADPRTNKVSVWWLWDGEREWRVGSLKKSERALPRREIWDATLLVERIESGWRPEDDV